MRKIFCCLNMSKLWTSIVFYENLYNKKFNIDYKIRRTVKILTVTGIS